MCISQFPEYDTYDFYHNKNQFQTFTNIIGERDLVKVRADIRRILYTDFNHSNDKKHAYQKKLIEFFNPEHIINTLQKIKSENYQAKFKYFLPSQNCENESRVNIYENEEDQKGKNNYLLTSVLQTEFRPALLKKKTVLKIQKNKKQTHHYLQKTRCYSFFNIDDLKSFQNNFKEFQSKNLSVKSMLNEMKKLNAKFNKISLSTFYRHFLKEQRLIYRKPKIVYPNKRDDKKKESRKVFGYFIVSLFQSNVPIYFYDETTFNSTMCFEKSWFLNEEPKEKIRKAPCSFFKLNLVTSFQKIISFSLTFDAFGSESVAEFLNASANCIRRDKNHKGPIVILMDNGPKNRSKMIQNMVDNNTFKVIYTTPTTPQQNYSECLFQVIKHKLSKYEEDESQIKARSSKDYLQQKIISVLFQLTKDDFVKAKNSYSHELILTLE